MIGMGFLNCIAMVVELGYMHDVPVQQKKSHSIMGVGNGI